CRGNDAAKCNIYGGYYQWDELMGYLNADNADNAGGSDNFLAEGKQGICPPEWHVATEGEWTELVNNYLGPGLAGWDLSDSFPVYGFHAKSQGLFYQNFAWDFMPPGFSATLFWTSTVSPADDTRIISHGVNTISPSVSKYGSAKSNGFPARCVRDQ
ncbi:MAG: FISUMP domain-containing protein, partial [Bacteroidota bacterium]